MILNQDTDTGLLEKQDEGAFRILDERGVLVDEKAPDLSEDRLLEIYRWMVFSRVFDERTIKLQRQGRMGTYAPLSGQEAALVGSACALEERDWVFPSYREHASLMIKGLPPEMILTYWSGNEEGSRIPEGVNVFTTSVPIATQILHAVGFSWAGKIKGRDIAALVYVGDGGTSEGDFHEGLNFAGVFQTPTIIFCNNNQYAISVPRTRQTRAKTIARKAIAYGIPGFQVDGNDPLAVYQVTREAVVRAHEGRGPTLIEAVTYRYGPHTTADDPTRYRTADELDSWKAKDPIKRMKFYMISLGIWDEEKDEELRKTSEEEIRKAVERYEAMPERSYEDLFTYLYAEPTPALREQMEELGLSLERKGD